MSWSKSGTVIRRFPLSTSRSVSVLTALGTDTLERNQLEIDCKFKSISSSLHFPSHKSCLRPWRSSAFFSTAPNFLEDEEYYGENSLDNRSSGTSSRGESIREITTTTSNESPYEQSTIDRIVSGGIGEYQSVDVDSVVTEDYLQRLVDDHISHGNVPPNPNMLLNMLELLHNEETHISSEVVFKIFREVVRSKRVKLLERAEDVVVKNRYDPRLLGLLVTGYINADSPRRACKLLLEWPNESIQHQPGIESYRRVLTALSTMLSSPDHDVKIDNEIVSRNEQEQQSGRLKNHNLAHRLLQHMCRTHLKFPELSLAPDRDCFHRVLGTCSSIESIPTAKDVLVEMRNFAAFKTEKKDNATTTPTEVKKTENSALFDTQPNLSTIRLLLKTWTTNVEGDKTTTMSLKEVFEFLRQVEADELSSERQHDVALSTRFTSSTIVDINTYNVLLNKLSEVGQYELAESFFRRLLADYLKGEKSNVQPDMVTLNTVLKSHVKAFTEEAAVSAERLLERLDDLYQQQERIRKNKNFVIDDDYADTPRAIYDIQPTARARSIVSNLWIKLGHPNRAIQILDKTESVFREKEQQLLQLQQEHAATAHSYSLDTIKRFRPDKISYRQIIGGLCKLQDPPTSALTVKAEEIGVRMLKMGHRLNLLTCNTILNCWTKSGNPDRAEVYLEETMREYNVIPDTVSYNTIIHGHAQLGNLDRALELLSRLLEDSLTYSQSKTKSNQRRSLYPKPNVRTFTNIFVALSKSKTIKAAEDAEALLLRMQELNDPPFNLDTRPNNFTYNAVMNCWASLSLPSSRRQRRRQSKKTNSDCVDTIKHTDNDNEHHRFGQRAEFVLRSMQGLGLNERPNAISYNTVIRAYSNDMSKAEELLRDMIANGLEPTEHTYKTLVHVLNRDFTIKNKDEKLQEVRELYFGSSPFLIENGRSLKSDKRTHRRRH